MPLRAGGADDDAVDLSALAGRLGGYSGADIEGLCRYVSSSQCIFLVLRGLKDVRLTCGPIVIH